MGLPDDELLEELEDELLEDELLEEELLEDELLDDELLDDEEELEELEEAPPDELDCPPQPAARIVTMTSGNSFVVILITQNVDVVIVAAAMPTPTAASNHTVKKVLFLRQYSQK